MVELMTLYNLPFFLVCVWYTFCIIDSKPRCAVIIAFLPNIKRTVRYISQSAYFGSYQIHLIIISIPTLGITDS